MAQIKLELVTVSRLMATAKTEQGEIVQIGYKKSANVLYDLQGKGAGHVFYADIERSKDGRLYNTDTLDVQKAYFEVEMMNAKRRLIGLQIAQAEM